MARTNEAADVYVADKTGMVRLDGQRIVVSKGYTTVRSGHPLYEQHKDMFVPLAVHYDVERPAAKAVAAKVSSKPEPMRPTVKDTTETRDVDF